MQFSGFEKFMKNLKKGKLKKTRDRFKKNYLEIEDEMGLRPIHWACVKGHVEIVQLLIEMKCELKCKTKRNETPLILAEGKDFLDCARLIRTSIIKKTFEFAETDDLESFVKIYDPTSLFVMKAKDYSSIVDNVIKNESHRIKGFVMGMKIEDEEILNWKIGEKKHDLFVSSSSLQECMLYRCIRHHHAEGFHILSTANIINRPSTLIFSSYLKIAAKFGSSAFIETIMKRTLYADDQLWNVAKNVAQQNGYNDIIAKISERQALLKLRKQAHFTRLHTAVYDNDPDMVEYILKYDVSNIDFNHPNCGTSLALAYSLCHEECIKIIQQFQIEVNTCNKFYQTPLHEAIDSGATTHCIYLMNEMGNIDCKGFMGLTPLQSAVIHGQIGTCQELIARNANCFEFVKLSPKLLFDRSNCSWCASKLPLSTNENAFTLCLKFHSTIYPCLLDKLNEGNINMRDGEGNSLVHIILNCLQVYIRNTDNNNDFPTDPNNPNYVNIPKETDRIINLIQLMIGHKADVHLQNNAGINAIMYASIINSEKIMLILLKIRSVPFEISEEDFTHAFSNRWFKYIEGLVPILSKDTLAKYINHDILCYLSKHLQSQTIKYIFYCSQGTIQQSTIEQLLLKAVTDNDYELFSGLIQTEIACPSLIENKETLLSFLIKEQKLDFVMEMISTKNISKFIQMKNQMGELPIHLAIHYRNNSIMRKLIIESHDLEVENTEGQTILGHMLENITKNPQIILSQKSFTDELMENVKTIIRLGADIYKVTSKGKTTIDECLNATIKSYVKQYYQDVRAKFNAADAMKVRETEAKICKICLDRHVDCVFDCGHTFCTECGTQMYQCPNCRMEPTNPKRFYLN